MRVGELEMSEHKIEMVCITCGETVRARIIKYGDGYIAVCPLCKQLSYNTKFKDSDVEEKFFEKKKVKAEVFKRTIEKNRKTKRKKIKRKKRKQRIAV